MSKVWLHRKINPPPQKAKSYFSVKGKGYHSVMGRPLYCLWPACYKELSWCSSAGKNNRKYNTSQSGRTETLSCIKLPLIPLISRQLYSSKLDIKMYLPIFTQVNNTVQILFILCPFVYMIINQTISQADPCLVCSLITPFQNHIGKTNTQKTQWLFCFYVLPPKQNNRKTD